MIDLHVHILPGLDDGAENMEDALEMAEMALESGVRTIVATPTATRETGMRIMIRKVCGRQQKNSGSNFRKIIFR